VASQSNASKQYSGKFRHGSLDPHESAYLTTSQSIQSFLHSPPSLPIVASDD